MGMQEAYCQSSTTAIRVALFMFTNLVREYAARYDPAQRKGKDLDKSSFVDTIYEGHTLESAKTHDGWIYVRMQDIFCTENDIRGFKTPHLSLQCQIFESFTNKKGHTRSPQHPEVSNIGNPRRSTSNYVLPPIQASMIGMMLHRTTDHSTVYNEQHPSLLYGDCHTRFAKAPLTPPNTS
ncbi:hypothetical protein BJ508DRAFT_309994 [Ascobolus immersus RN42]|uniref:Uncharacterized protein n=1 Tax=Ascobolus immersus RN42 TaxID=1160509 RepID=A0A3N4I0M3_ASCIM|nr:hypothetical protein BJ508DRAFT_309994 [Ascobolus immersus RN42]